MRLNHGMLALMLSGAVLVSASVTGCGSTLVYDSDWRDYHRWSPDENRYYRQWEIGTHRDHSAFQRRSDKEQREYWGWRHN